MTQTQLQQGMVWVPGGSFSMGSDRHYPEERPAHRVTVDGFWIDSRTVTNAEFAQFVKETGYMTVAEQPLDPAQYPGAKPELLVPGALVFHMTDGPVDKNDISNWWRYIPGACWYDRQCDEPYRISLHRAAHGKRGRSPVLKLIPIRS
jgi:formylglycine-generating enzyme